VVVPLREKIVESKCAIW